MNHNRLDANTAQAPLAPEDSAASQTPRNELRPVETPSEAVREAKEAAAPRVEVPGELLDRVARVERQNRRLRFVALLLFFGVAYLGYLELFPEGVVVHKTLMESEEVKLIDNTGNPRLFLRMYSRVPVLQILDGHGKPRMSLGLRFDDTPFLDLSDKHGNTRATFEMTESDEPTLRLFDRNGETTFQIN